MRLFKLVTFDVTNTLLHFRIPPSDQYARTVAEFGVDVRLEDVRKSFGSQWKLLNEESPNFGAVVGETSVAWWTRFVGRTLAGAGGCASDDRRIPPIARRLLETYSTDEGWAVAPGARDALGVLKANGVKLGVISNFDERLDALLVNVKLRDRFDFVVCSYDAGCMKPERGIFDLALKSCPEPVASSEALHVGDDVDLDYAGARNAGWKAALLLGTEDNRAALPRGVDVAYVLNNVGEVPGIILKQNSASGSG